MGLLTPAREGLNRVYSHKDRVRLQLILRGKRVGLSLSEIRELLDLYDENDDGAAQMARSLKKFRERAIKKNGRCCIHQAASIRTA